MVNSWANSFKKYVSADGTIGMIYRNDNIFEVLRKETEYFDVVLDESVKKIDSVFADCKYLKSIVFPNSITSIARGIFSYCSSLENVIVKSNNSTFYSSGNCIIEKATGKLYIGCQNSVIPENITTIGAFAFSYNTMTNITIPNNITTIENFAFQYCNKLEHITLSNNLTELSIGLFKGCSSLIDITIQKNVKSINFSDRVTGTFADCTSLERIVVDNNNTVYKSFQNCLLSKDGTILYLAAKNFTLPNTLTEIGKYAFTSCPKTLTIPNSVTNICDYAFTKELEVINLPSSLEYIGYGAFEYCENLNSLNISGNSKYETALGSLLKTENGEKQLWIGSNRGEITSDAIVYHNAFRGRKVKYFIIPVKMQVDFIGGFLYEEHKDSKLLYSEEKSCLEKETWYGNDFFKDRTFYFLTVKIQPGDRYVWTYDDKMENIIIVD